MEPEINKEYIIDNQKYKCFEIFSVQNCWNCDLRRTNLINNKKCDFKCNSEERSDNKIVFLKKL